MVAPLGRKHALVPDRDLASASLSVLTTLLRRLPISSNEGDGGGRYVIRRAHSHIPSVYTSSRLPVNTIRRMSLKSRRPAASEWKPDADEMISSQTGGDEPKRTSCSR